MSQTIIGTDSSLSEGKVRNIAREVVDGRYDYLCTRVNDLDARVTKELCRACICFGIVLFILALCFGYVISTKTDRNRDSIMQLETRMIKAHYEAQDAQSKAKMAKEEARRARAEADAAREEARKVLKRVEEAIQRQNSAPQGR
jgi:hypothetical protein